jgi:hypothetical protein
MIGKWYMIIYHIVLFTIWYKWYYIVFLAYDMIVYQKKYDIFNVCGLLIIILISNIYIWPIFLKAFFKPFLTACVLERDRVRLMAMPWVQCQGFLYSLLQSYVTVNLTSVLKPGLISLMPRWAFCAYALQS